MIDCTNERRRRVLHIVPVNGIGGVEIAAKSMLDHDCLDFDFRLLFINPQRQVRSPWWSKQAEIVRAPARYHAAWHAASSYQPDVLICSLWKSIPLSLLLKATHPKLKLVFLLHNDVPVHMVDALLSRVAMWLADAVWADSPSTLAKRRVPTRKAARAISFVISHPAQLPRRSVSYEFVSWGRLNDQKGFDRAIDLVSIIVSQGHDVHYDIYGPDGGAQASLEHKIAALGLSHRVRLKGPVAKEDIAAVVDGRSLFLQLSRSEGMCMAAVEAMQLGLVPVVTAVGHMPAYIEPGKSGIIVDPDRLDDAADAITNLLADPLAFAEYSTAAQQYWRNAPTYAEDLSAAIRDL